MATAYDRLGGTLARGFTWSTSSGAVATVDPTGLVTGVSTGTAEITATSDGPEAAGVAVITVN